MNERQLTASVARDGGRGWPKPERDRQAKVKANGTDASAFAMTKGKATVKGGNTFHAKANGSAFAGKGRRAMPFKATGHKGGISFR